ncbi:MAG: hypothetical protein O7C65_08650 [Planctomycetota bacterium]|nr:hypothetical protein [Planctomycetota bacterium]
MIRPWINTREWVRRSTWPIMSGLLVVSVAAACEQRMIELVAAGGNVMPAQISHAFGGTAGGEPSPAETRAELQIPQVGAHPTDPGADALVRSILASLDSPARAPGGETRVCVDRLRNQSHCSQREFASLRRRLADGLNRSGRSDQIRFVADAAQPAHYELHGTAYLVTARGLDQWELYLSLRPAGQAWTIWRADAAVHMLRQPRPGEPEIILP